MCSKPMPFTPLSVFSLTILAREAKDVSSNAPETDRELWIFHITSWFDYAQVYSASATNVFSTILECHHKKT